MTTTQPFRPSVDFEMSHRPDGDRQQPNAMHHLPTTRTPPSGVPRRQGFSRTDPPGPESPAGGANYRPSTSATGPLDTMGAVVFANAAARVRPPNHWSRRAPALVPALPGPSGPPPVLRCAAPAPQRFECGLSGDQRRFPPPAKHIIMSRMKLGDEPPAHCSSRPVLDEWEQFERHHLRRLEARRRQAREAPGPGADPPSPPPGPSAAQEADDRDTGIETISRGIRRHSLRDHSPETTELRVLPEDGRPLLPKTAPPRFRPAGYCPPRKVTWKLARRYYVDPYWSHDYVLTSEEIPPRP
jgi:hypothetical protein